MKRNSIIIALTGFVLLVVVLLAIRQYYSSRNRGLSSFQAYQLLHAQYHADRILSFFWGQSQGLRALPSPYETDVLKETEADARTYFQQVQKAYVKAISIYDDTGTIIYSTNSKSVGSKVGQEEFIAWAKKKENERKLFVSSVPLLDCPGNPGPGSFCFLLATPLYQDMNGTKHPKPERKFIGVLSFTLDLKEFLDNELKDSRMGMHQIWIIDTKGTLIFHSEHPEMVSRNIYIRDENCLQCHVSFDYAKAVLKKKQGTGDYKLRNSPKKIVAFAPVEFANLSWIVVINSTYDEVTAFTRKDLLENLVHLVIVVLSMIAGAVFIIRNDRLRIRAQEDARHWQERTAERERVENVLRESEKQLRYLSSQLLTAQEKERKRISGELHDELGGALAAIKFRLSLIEKKLPEEQRELRKECEETLNYLDQVLENVRRFSRDLSPYVLEYFGLSVALRRLVTDFSKNYNVQLRLDIMEVDQFFPQDAQIIIYRIFQEILNNTGKHAQATHLSVSTNRLDGSISFQLEDDGKGFDLNRILTMDASGKGIGLAIIDERVRMLGGTLDLWSEEGKGTRIIFTIPTAKGENA